MTSETVKLDSFDWDGITAIINAFPKETPSSIVGNAIVCLVAEILDSLGAESELDRKESLLQNLQYDSCVNQRLMLVNSIP